MVITRTPLRVSFFGGGTDFPEFFSENRGAVVSSTINRYSHQIVSEFPSRLFDYAIRVSYSKGELVKHVKDIQHPVIRACLQHCGFSRNVELHYAADLPSFTGLGSSSSFTVGLLHALHAFRGERVLPSQLANEAVHIEREVLKECVGLQDQYSSAFGGFNFIEFSGTAEPKVSHISISMENLELLQQHIVLIFTKIKRKAVDIEQSKNLKNTQQHEALIKMRDLAYTSVKIFEARGKLDIHELGKLLEEGWSLKKSLSPLVSNSEIDRLYDIAKKHGAIAGKLLGAGGGGFLMFLAPPEIHMQLAKAFRGHYVLHVELGTPGSEVIFDRRMYSKKHAKLK